MLPPAPRLLTVLAAVALVVAAGLALDPPWLWVVAGAVVLTLLVLDPLELRARGAEREPAGDAAPEGRLVWAVRALPFLAGFLAAETVEGAGPSLAAFTVAFVAVLAATEALLHRLTAPHRRSP
jgi:hypothetical protein